MQGMDLLVHVPVVYVDLSHVRGEKALHQSGVLGGDVVLLLPKV